MNIIKTDKPYVYNICKNEFYGEIYLDWKSVECTDFLVINTNDISRVQICNNDENCDLINQINDKIDILLSQKVLTANSLNIRLVNYTTLRKNGGFCIGNNPGYYIIYGIKYIGNSDFNIFAFFDSIEENSIKIRVDICISAEPYYELKSRLFHLKPKKKYSGYKKISIDKKVNCLKCGDLFYIINEKWYPIPVEVLQDSGCFYIKANENDKIEFDSKIKEVILK